MDHSDRPRAWSQPVTRQHGPKADLANNGPVGSMGRVSVCGDNPAMESFFALLQQNVFDRPRWNTRDELRLAIIIGIERIYHRRLGRLAPVEYKTLSHAASAA